MEAFIPTSAFCGRCQAPLGVTSWKPQHKSWVTYSSKRASVVRHNGINPIMSTTVTNDRIANKSYQLEEDEDSLSCTSAIYLNEDGTLSIGRTDGPKPDRVYATWKYSDEEGEIVLNIERFFGADTNTPFSVKRILRGHIEKTSKNLSDLAIFSGGMYQEPADFSPQSEVGWFSMIIATDDLPTDDFDISTSQ